MDFIFNSNFQMEDDKIIDEVLQNNSEIHNIQNIPIISKGTVKIEFNDWKASGFFLKFQRNKGPFHCLLTNQHVITSYMVNNKETITIKYDNENKELKLKLNPTKRIIVCFQDFYELDVTLVEITKDDKIKEEFYLSPKVNYNYSFKDFCGKDIQIVQYPGGNDLSYSEGKITRLYNNDENIFYHSSSTQRGSSGSPVVLKGEHTVLAIHKGSNLKENAGIFIKNIVEIMKDYSKKNLNFKNKNNNIQNSLKTIVTGSIPMIHIISNMIGEKCTKCGHLTERHNLIENTEDIWECQDCSTNTNICALKLFNY